MRLKLHGQRALHAAMKALVSFGLTTFAITKARFSQSRSVYLIALTTGTFDNLRINCFTASCICVGPLEKKPHLHCRQGVC
jgi:hypothetical protein